MNKILMIAIAAGTAVAAVSPALAADGCGRGGHAGPYGHCRPNHGPGPGFRGPREGAFRPDRGYWHGGHYYHHRDRWHGGWRYR